MIYTVTLNPALDRELTVPEIQFDEVLRATGLHIDYGGKGFNVSRALEALGQRSVALGFLGGGAGVKIALGLEELGISVDAVDIRGETRTNVSIVSEADKRHVKVNEFGPIVTQVEQETLLDKVQTLARPGDWWVLGGSLPRGVPDDFYAKIVNRVQLRGARVLLDAAGAPLKHGCEALPYLVKPSLSQALELTGLSPTEGEDIGVVLAAVHELGAKTVVVTLGEDGAAAFDGADAWLVEPPKVEVYSTVGASGALMAGLIWGLSQKFSLDEALRWGVAAGAVSASREGTAVARRGAVEPFVQAVTVSPLSVPD
jgi:1-phosphofructokinase family hexose kinase